MKQIFVILLFITVFISQIRCEYDEIEGEGGFLTEIMKKYDPNGTQQFDKKTYTFILLETIKKGKAQSGQEFPEGKLSILFTAISDFVDFKYQNLEKNISHESIYEDLLSNIIVFLQENIKQYKEAYSMLYDDSEILPPLDDEEMKYIFNGADSIDL